MTKGWLDHDRFAVFGLGRSGIAAANLLARRGKQVLASDSSTSVDTSGLDESVDVSLGENRWDSCELVIASPGLKPSLRVFSQLPDDLPVVSEIELAWEASAAPFLAITGTDGKTTTTSLCAHILQKAGVETVAAGNIGTPLCDVVEDIGSDGCIVAEVSAFQLWSTHHFRPRASAFTNIAADHLDYFVTWDEYVEAKHRLVHNHTTDDWGVFNADDAIIRRWIAEYRGPMALYGEYARHMHVPLAMWVDRVDGEDWIWVRREGEDARPWFDLRDTRLKGRHNASNIMAATGLALSRGIELHDVANGVASFQPLPHRVQPCGTKGGVAFFDDSKATNAHAAMAGIKSLDPNLVVIAGGVDKGLELGEFARLLRERARAVVLIGEIRDRLRQALVSAGMDEEAVVDASTMEEAVARAYDRAKPDATVLLSPACSSFDMFDSYAHRGEVFQAAVARLEG